MRMGRRLASRILYNEESVSLNYHLFELPRHGDEFGRFALEFSIDTLKSLQAFPVFYIPQATSTTGEDLSLGSTLVVQAIDAMLLAMRFVEMKKQVDTFPPVTSERTKREFGFQDRKVFNLDVTETRRVLQALTHVLTPPEVLENALAGLLTLFYPADDVPRDNALKYYRQREWRIASNFGVTQEGVMRHPSPGFVNRLIDIDAGFFGREFPPKTLEDSSGKRLADDCYVYPEADGKRIIEFANRAIVPAKAVEQATAILQTLSNPPPVTSLEEIAVAKN